MPQVFHMARDDADEPESDGSYAKVEAMSVPSSAWADKGGGRGVLGCSCSPKSRFFLYGIQPWLVVVPVRVASGAQASQTLVSYPGSSWERCSEGGSARISDASH